MIKYDMPEKEYRSHPALSQSILKEYGVTPLHGHAMELGQRVKKSSAFNIGKIAHAAIIEPTRFKETSVIAPEINKNTKEYKEFKANHSDKIIVEREDYDSVCAMVRSVMDHPIAGIILGQGKSEVSAFAKLDANWGDGEDGTKMMSGSVECKARFDWLPEVDEYNSCIVDVKTCEIASKKEFEKSILYYGYELQAAYYIDIAKKAGLDREQFIFICVEKEPPYAVAVYYVDEIGIKLGQKRYQDLLGVYAKCLAKNYWPGYSDQIESISLPEWKLKKEVAVI